MLFYVFSFPIGIYTFENVFNFEMSLEINIKNIFFLPVPLIPEGRIRASYLPWPKIWSKTFFSFSLKLIFALFALWRKKLLWLEFHIILSITVLDIEIYEASMHRSISNYQEVAELGQKCLLAKMTIVAKKISSPNLFLFFCEPKTRTWTVFQIKYSWNEQNRTLELWNHFWWKEPNPWIRSFFLFLIELDPKTQTLFSLGLSREERQFSPTKINYCRTEMSIKCRFAS